MGRHDLSAWMLAGATMCVSTLCHAMELGGGWTANTFLSAAAVSTNENEYRSRTDDAWRFDLIEAGVTTAGNLAKSTRIAAQLLSRRLGDDNGDPNIDFAYIQQTLFENESGSGLLRVGRVKRPIGLDAEVRDVAFARTSIFSPQTIIFDLARDTVLSQDGALFVWDWNTFSHQFTVEFSEAYPRTDADDLESILGFTNGALQNYDMSGDAKAELSPAYRLSWLWVDYNLRVVFGSAKLTYEYDFNDESIFRSGNVVLTANTLGVEKTVGSWVFSTEYLDPIVKYKDMQPLPEEAPAYSYYYQALYNFSPKVYGVIRHEHTYVLKDDRSGKRIASQFANTPFAVHDFRFYNKETTLSVTWQTTPNFLLRAELHLFDGATLARGDQRSDYEKDWRLYALQAAFRF